MAGFESQHSEYDPHGYWRDADDEPEAPVAIDFDMAADDFANAPLVSQLGRRGALGAGGTLNAGLKESTNVERAGEPRYRTDPYDGSQGRIG